MSPKFLIATAGLAAALSAQATVSVTSAAFTYAQSFDSLAASGSGNAWTNDSTLTGWSLFNKNFAAITTYGTTNTAANTTGGFYSLGTTAERALGALGSGGTVFGSPANGAVAGWIAAAFTNNAGVALTSFTLGYDGEQWRNAGATAVQTMTVEYGFGATFATVASWTGAGAGFSFASPVHTATAAIVDGNAAGQVAGLGGTVATNWAAGQTLWVRWVETNDTGSDHTLAIDNVSLRVTAVPEPESYAMLLAGLAVVGFVARRRRG